MKTITDHSRYTIRITLDPNQFVKNQHVLSQLEPDVYVWLANDQIATRNTPDAEICLHYLESAGSRGKLNTQIN